MVPFMEEMLRHGTQVILSVNMWPILCDITYVELSLLLGQVSDVICSGLDTGHQGQWPGQSLAQPDPPSLTTKTTQRR